MELAYIFDESFSVLEQLGDFRVEQDEFFLETGEQVSGEIVHVGRIGSFGVSPEASGTLAPAGGGRLRLVETDTANVAERLVENPQGVATLPIFLYESLDELVETDRGTSLADTVEGGGIIGYVIIAIGAIAIVLIVIRIVILSSLGKTDKAGMDAVYQSVQDRDLDQARASAEKQPGAMGRVLSATVNGLRVDPENIEDVISESVLNEQPRVDRYRSALSVFAAVAPLLGLLGTVTGMISTFEVITQFGTGDPRLLSGGISEALITTEFGLIVAIPVLLIGNLLSSWADRITSNTEVAALRVVNIHAGYERADTAESKSDDNMGVERPLAGEANA
jgi:biopolymer transport protein ExbB